MSGIWEISFQSGKIDVIIVIIAWLFRGRAETKGTDVRETRNARCI